MTRYTNAILLYFFAVTCSFGDSFLKATSFPKTFQDVPFSERLEILREGYLPFRIIYDENGICVSGCAYHGITIKEDMQAVDQATNEMSDLIEKSESDDALHAVEPVKENDAADAVPSQPLAPISAGEKIDSGLDAARRDWCHNGKSSKLPLRYPVDMSNFKYKISSDFGFRTSSPNGARFHPAIDIACPVGTPVYATADGVIVTVGNETKSGGAGRYINIKHDNGLITQYLHLNTVSVSKGDKVHACQQIATSGNSGKSASGNPYAAHLDYRIRFNSNENKYVDLLCPCKTTNRKTQNSYDNELDLSCAHSLFNASYKFKNSGTKHSKWRIEHGHCMQNMNSLLPDEVAQ